MVKQQLELKKRVLSTKQKRLPSQQLGQLAELQARSFLLSKKYEILDCNIRCKLKEVDIIALDTQYNEIVFIEVKARSSTQYGHPSSAINYKKIRNMQAVANAYLRKHRLQNEYRFDSITVSGTTLEHFENITWP